MSAYIDADDEFKRRSIASQKGAKTYKARNPNPGMTKYPEYNIWRRMRQRCGVVGPGRSRYVARGMYDEWKPLRTGFYAFLEYVHTTIGPFPGEGWSIDRINNDVGYFPGNIRWLPTKENILYGASIGGSLGGKTGWHHTTEAKAKIAAASRERLSSPEQRAKMSERALGEKNGFYGKTHSSETRAKISAAHKKRAQLKEKRIINCEWCRNEFHPRGKTARFCSYRCRNMWMISVQVKQICSCGRQIVPGAMKRHRNASGHDLDKDSP